jgi:hypothetical protein
MPCATPSWRESFRISGQREAAVLRAVGSDLHTPKPWTSVRSTSVTIGAQYMRCDTRKPFRPLLEHICMRLDLGLIMAAPLLHQKGG